MLLPLAHDKTELIEVVRITDPMRHLSAEDLVGDDIAIWEAAQAQQVLALVNDLPGSEVYRCFTPGWGIRAHGATDLLFQLAFCFRCHGARLWGPAVPAEQEGIHSFDPDSPPARELLQRLRGSKSGWIKGLFRNT
ncbi:hypothetical protein [Actinacidiphila oryziradicis]|uniref:Uncharacterized protein n=1 Tax=Actinacidiphila oryziradicis TaxID=2571141 RepID=A0A4U0RIY3_9ACTN|nr:hypothetical protein [Actinacidiphila oryziradicis]TJZ95207.1 hypothetical protein FCI23_52455 [Actinacidiphila oryziradicis]